ncbi:amino acid ABC transporter substrate-binding protein [Salinimonas profundi]
MLFGHRFKGMYIGLLAWVMLHAGPAQAALWSITYPRPLSENDMRAEYPVALLTLALEKTGVKYSLLPSERILLQGKALRRLKENREVNVVWSMTDVQRERDLLPIRIPIAKGLIGWRVFLTTKNQLAQFSQINSKSGLRAMTPVQGEEWPDTKILQANGFNVFTVPEYEEAMGILQTRQASFFPRSVIEVISELESGTLPADIVLEKRLALYYPTAMYFFVNRGNPTLARLIETGLQRAIEDGSFDALFESTYQETFKRLELDKRQIFMLDNPALPEETPLEDKALWHQPRGTNVNR